LDVTAALKLRGPEAKTLIFTVTQEEEWQLYAPEGRPSVVPELPFKIPGVWWNPWSMSAWRLWMRIS
jgi:hypothetical protein